MGRKALCCTDNLLVLMVCGVFVVLMGLVLLIIYLVARGITSSLHLVEPPIPTYVAALLTITLGVISIVLTKKRHVLLICSSMLLSVLDLIVCIVHAVTAGLVSIPFLGSFSVCVLRATTAECQCYVLGEGSSSSSNSSVIVPGDTTKHFTFQGVKSCISIETALKDFLYTLCILYSFTACGCIVTGTLSSLLLCRHRRSDKAQGDREVRSNTGRRMPHAAYSEDETRERNASSQRVESAASPRVSSLHGREATTQSVPQGRRRPEATTQVTPQGRRPAEAATQVTPQGRRPPGGTAATSHSQPVRRSASVTSPPSSTAAAASGGARPATRYNSVGGSSSEMARQRPRIPLLVRSGYLQSHVNAPRVPVYSVQGSNESYVALTDLPKLQLPALDQVPAYVREVELPSYEPPPYSPTADRLSESPELTADQSPSARQRLTFPDDSTTMDEGNGSEHPSLVPLEPPENIQSFAAVEHSSTSQATVLVTDGQQEELFGQRHTETLAAEEVIVHERDVSDHESINDLDSEAVSLEAADPGENDSAMDLQPPDILMEAIESARTSLNVTAAVIEDDANNEQTSDSQRQQRCVNEGSSVQVSHGLLCNDLGDSRDESPHLAIVGTSQLSSGRHTDHREDANADRGRRRDVRRSESFRRTTRDHMESLHQTVEYTEGRRVPQANDQLDIPVGNRARSASPNHQSVQRSKSLSSPTNRDRERSMQMRPSMPKDGRHAGCGERGRRAVPTKKTSHSPQRQRQTGSNQKRRERARSQGTQGSPSRGASSAENLSDIISLVEKVHNTSTEQSKRRKKQKKSSKRDGMLDSKV